MKVYENVGDVQQTTSTTWKWTIKNYSNYKTSNRTKVFSPHFSVLQSNDITNWCFEIYPNGYNEENKNFLSVFLRNLDEADVTATSEFSILSQSNGLIVSRSSSKTDVFSKLKSWGYLNFRSHEFLNDESKKALTNNTLVLQYQIVVEPKKKVLENSEANLLTDDFEKLLESERHSDVTFVIGRKKMHLHKAILSSRSPVFQAMFEHDMKENQQNTVKITDVKFDVLKEMCRYIYTGKVNEIAGIAKDLLIAADKYCIKGLKTLCEKSICDQLNNSNAVECLQVATTYNAEHLKPKVYDFVTSHIKDIYKKPQFKELDGEIKDEIIGIIIGDKTTK